MFILSQDKRQLVNIDSLKKIGYADTTTKDVTVFRIYGDDITLGTYESEDAAEYAFKCLQNYYISCSKSDRSNYKGVLPLVHNGPIYEMPSSDQVNYILKAKNGQGVNHGTI